MILLMENSSFGSIRLMLLNQLPSLKFFTHNTSDHSSFIFQFHASTNQIES